MLTQLRSLKTLSRARLNSDVSKPCSWDRHRDCSRQCRLPSLPPHDEDVPVWQEDWRAFRSHLVHIEKQEALAAQRVPDRTRPSRNPGNRTPQSCRSASSKPSDVTPPNRPSRPSAPAGHAISLHRHHVNHEMQQPVPNGACACVASAGGQGWAHELPGPEVGSVLLSSQDNAAHMGTLFNRSVILIISHDEAHGSVGLVLNKASPLTVNDITTITDVEGFQSEFGNERLMVCGPLHSDYVTVLHTFRGLSGAVCVTEGLFTGGLTSAIALLKARLASASDFFLGLGLSGWGPGQLAQEIKSGSWYSVAVSPELLLPRPQSLRLRMHLSQLAPDCRQPTTGADGGSLGKLHQSARHGQQLTSRQWYAMTDPERNDRVPPLLPPPTYPAHPNSEICMWRRVMKAAQLL